MAGIIQTSLPAIFQDMDTQKEPELLATETKESDRAMLESKSVLVLPHPPAPAAIEASTWETIIAFPLGWISEPQPAEKFPTVEDAAQQNASPIRVFTIKSIHTNNNTRNISDNPVSTNDFLESGGVGNDGKILRLQEEKFRGFEYKFEVFIMRTAIRGTGVTYWGYSHLPIANLFRYAEHEKVPARAMEI
ncbi:hypothetical protein BDD12DRAFT_883854 [Trichophaea hybrida]|nr:hypothetical protein BDD12DRAFT_883854 [Trichophaea hybrida]